MLSSFVFALAGVAAAVAEERALRGTTGMGGAEARRLQGPESSDLVACSNNGCWYGEAGSGTQTWVEGLWVTHPNIYYRCVNPRQIALTFDDGPTVFTKTLLDELDKLQVVATFFVTAQQLQQEPYLGPLLTRAEAAGHVIGSKARSNDTAGASTSTIDFLVSEIDAVTAATSNLLPRAGLRPFFRPSFPNSGIDTQTADSLSQRGIYIIALSLDSADDLPTATQQSVTDRIVQNINPSSPGTYSYIVLQHETVPFTTQTIETIVSTAQGYGYQFVGMDECIGLQQLLNTTCEGAPCANLAHCRSQAGECGEGPAFCSETSMWKPECNDNITASSCGGTPCTDKTQCRSKWGFCGSGAAYCGDSPEWTPLCETKGTCNGEPCPGSNGTSQCRSADGVCGEGPAFCAGSPSWEPSCPPKRCTGAPCDTADLCRSCFGYCGTGDEYCMDQPQWEPVCVNLTTTEGAGEETTPVMNTSVMSTSVMSTSVMGTSVMSTSEDEKKTTMTADNETTTDDISSTMGTMAATTGANNNNNNGNGNAGISTSPPVGNSATPEPSSAAARCPLPLGTTLAALFVAAAWGRPASSRC